MANVTHNGGVAQDVGEKYVASMDMQVNGGVAVAAFANHAIVRADLLSGSYAPRPRPPPLTLTHSCYGS